jgi:single-strand DNA-binding protein
MGESRIEITGNLVRDPELRYTKPGVPVCTLTVAVTPRIRYGDVWRDGETQYWVVSAWRSLGEHVSLSLERGDPVTVSGRVTFKTYKTKNDETRIQHEINADRVSVPLDYHVAMPAKVARDRQEQDADAASAEPAASEAPPFATVPRLQRVRVYEDLTPE